MAAARLLRTRLFIGISAISFVFLSPLALSAQPAYGTDRDDVRTVSSWQRLEQLSVQLDQQASRARSEARADRRHHGSEEFAERLDDFAKEAHRFRALVSERGVPSSKINDELRKLVDEGGKAQREFARAERHDPQTDADWNRTRMLLDEVNNDYLAANGLAAPMREPDRDRDRDRSDDRWRGGGNEANNQALPGTWNDNRRTLLNDLDRRADDAARLSESANMEISPDVERLRDQVRTFEQNAPRLTPDDTRASIEQMLSEARGLQASLSGSNAPPRLVDDVNGMVDALAQMRNSHTVVGTSGYGVAGPAVGPGAYADMDASQLTEELETRLSGISTMAGQYGSDDVSQSIAKFSDRVRDFDSRAPRMSQEDRRETVDSLLQDAQKTQRDLASRHVSSELVRQWNDVVDLLVQLRNRS